MTLLPEQMFNKFNQFQKGRQQEALVPVPEKDPFSRSCPTNMSQSRKVYEVLGEQCGGDRRRDKGTCC